MRPIGRQERAVWIIFVILIFLAIGSMVADGIVADDEVERIENQYACENRLIETGRFTADDYEIIHALCEE